MGAIEMEECDFTPRGLKFDRRYMLIDRNNKFLSQRTRPQMGNFLLRFSSHTEGFTISHKGDELQFPFELNRKEHNVKTAHVWEDEVEVLIANDTINSWFSRHLEQSVQLVFLPEESPRPIPAEYQPEPSPKFQAQHPKHHVSLADGFPILIVSEASLNELNIRIQQSNPEESNMEMMRFRPNVVLKEIAPHQEDFLATFHLGTSQLMITKPCSRCVLTTINPDTLTKGAEPLKTLGQYRKFNNKILFGANAICLQPGKIAITH